MADNSQQFLRDLDKKLWTAADRLRANLAVDGLNVAFDMPTLMGRDSDDPQALGEVGHCGVAIDSAADMDVLFDGIDLADVTTTHDDLRPGRAGLLHVPGRRRAAGRRPVQAGRHAADRHLQGVHRAEGVAVRARAAPAPHRRPDGVLRRRDPAVQAAVGVRATTSGRPARPPRRSWRTRWPTASATSSWGCPAGWTSTRSRPGLSFFFDAHVDFFEEIAKFRAARRIWARWMRDVYGATDEKALWLKFHTQTAGVSLTAQQPVNNVVRTAVEALAAVLGGTNSLHTNALDETLALPTDESAEIALRTQQVLMEETGVTNVADPLGGSWYVEALTDRIEAEAEAIFARIRAAGGTRRHAIGPMPRHPARHRGRLVHRRDRRVRLRLPAGAGEGRQEDRRRQLPHRHGRQGAGDPAGLARGRARAEARCWPPRAATATRHAVDAALARMVEVAADRART